MEHGRGTTHSDALHAAWQNERLQGRYYKDIDSGKHTGPRPCVLATTHLWIMAQIWRVPHADSNSRHSLAAKIGLLTGTFYPGPAVHRGSLMPLRPQKPPLHCTTEGSLSSACSAPAALTNWPPCNIAAECLAGVCVACFSVAGRASLLRSRLRLRSCGKQPWTGWRAPRGARSHLRASPLSACILDHLLPLQRDG
jgi:hypothetical protein